MRIQKLLTQRPRSRPARVAEDLLSTDFSGCEPMRRLSLLLAELGQSRSTVLAPDELFFAERIAHLARESEQYTPSPIMLSLTCYIVAKCESALAQQAL